MKQKIHIIVAMTEDRIIGRDGKLPWHIVEDLKLFKRLTMGSTVIMGRETFMAIGRPLPGRNNIVVSTTLNQFSGITVVRSVDEAFAKGKEYGRPIFIIGGQEIFQQTLPFTERMYISYIRGKYEGDAFFPVFDPAKWEVVQQEPYREFTLVVYEKKHIDGLISKIRGN
ncbi:MAG: dihydrofolate reductase [Spirochaetota bacterium]